MTGTETLELACFIKCDGGLEIDNADVIIAFVEHMNGAIEVVGEPVVTMRVPRATVERAVTDALNQRAKDAKDETALLNAEIW